MKLSKPIPQLKSNAKVLARQLHIPLHQALDAVAKQEGFAAWSHLSIASGTATLAKSLYCRIQTGQITLVGARPGQGKTTLCIQLAHHAVQAGRAALIFTLEFAERECSERFGATKVEFDCSDEICASYIEQRLSQANPGTLAVVDYLQLLDQRRHNPSLPVQVEKLRDFAREKELTILFISQIDRRFDPTAKPCPGPEDVRLPNPLDLNLFDSACFLHAGQLEYHAPCMLPERLSVA